MFFFKQKNNKSICAFLNNKNKKIKIRESLLFLTKKTKKTIRESLFFLSKKQKNKNTRIFAFPNKKETKTKRENLCFSYKKTKKTKKRTFAFLNKKTKKKKSWLSLSSPMAEGSSFSPRIDLIFSSSLFPLCKIVLNFKKKNRSIFPHAKFSSIWKIYFEIWLYVKPMAEGSSVSPRIDLIFSSMFPLCEILLNFKNKS